MLLVENYYSSLDEQLSTACVLLTITYNGISPTFLVEYENEFMLYNTTMFIPLRCSAKINTIRSTTDYLALLILFKQ